MRKKIDFSKVRNISLLSDQSVTYRIMTAPFRLGNRLNVRGNQKVMRLLLMVTLLSTMILPHQVVFGLVILCDFLGILTYRNSNRKLKVIDILLAVFSMEVVYMLAVFSKAQEVAECMFIMSVLVLFYFMLCIYVGKEHIERIFVFCCSILSVERLLKITVSAERWHDNQHAAFQLFIFAVPLCIRQFFNKKRSVRMKWAYFGMMLLILVTIAIPILSSKSFTPEDPASLVTTFQEYHVPFRTAMIEFARAFQSTLYTLPPVFSVCCGLSLLGLIFFLITESISELNNPITILAAALAVAGGGASGLLAENIRAGLWENINMLIIFWAMIAVVTAEEEKDL